MLLGTIWELFPDHFAPIRSGFEAQGDRQASVHQIARASSRNALITAPFAARRPPLGDGSALAAPQRAWRQPEPQLVGATPFAEADVGAAKRQWRNVADQLRPRVPKLAALMDSAENDVLAFMSFPREHRAKLHSTNPLERLNGEIKRRTHVVGIFPNEAAVTRLVGALLLEQNDEWAVQRRYMTLETFGAVSDAATVSLPAVAA